MTRWPGVLPVALCAWLDDGATQRHPRLGSQYDEIKSENICEWKLGAARVAKDVLACERAGTHHLLAPVLPTKEQIERYLDFYASPFHVLLISWRAHQWAMQMAAAHTRVQTAHPRRSCPPLASLRFVTPSFNLLVRRRLSLQEPSLDLSRARIHSWSVAL